MPSFGPSFGDFPLFGGDVPGMIVLVGAGQWRAELNDCHEGYSESADDIGVVVKGLTGQDAAHGWYTSPAAPYGISPMEIELSYGLASEEARNAVEVMRNAALVGVGQVWIDRPLIDLWSGDPLRTTYVTSRRFGFASAVPFASRGARVAVNRVNVPVVPGAPGPGEVQIDPSTDGDQLIFGTAPIQGDVVECLYYPLVRFHGLSPAREMDSFNSGVTDVSFTEMIEAKQYGG